MDVIALVLWSSLLLVGRESEAELAGRPGPHAGRTGGGRRSGHRDAAAHRPAAGKQSCCASRCRRGCAGSLLRLAEQVLSGMRAFHDWRRFAGFAGLTVLIWLSDAVGVMALGRALNLGSPLRPPFCYWLGWAWAARCPPPRLRRHLPVRGRYGAHAIRFQPRQRPGTNPGPASHGVCGVLGVRVMAGTGCGAERPARQLIPEAT